MTVFREEVPPAVAGERLDRFVAMVTGRSRSEAVDLIDAGSVTINGTPSSARARRMLAGETVEISAPDAVEGEPAVVADTTIEVRVVHEDADLIVVDKPAGLVVHPGAGHSSGTLVHGLLARYPELAAVGQPDRPGIVHRLDRGTSGLLAVARTPAAYDALVEALSEHRVGRHYVALAWGHPESPRGVIDAPIGRSTRDATRMAVRADGRSARTHYEVVQSFDEPIRSSLLRCRLETGRTHQIRVHLEAIGHPVVGDVRYGKGRGAELVDRPLLHAERLELRHPIDGSELSFTSPLPADLVAALDRLH